MAKIVRYNGKSATYYSCSEPTKLVLGKEYEVIKEKDRGCQTDYTLKGVDGEFNSCWFDVISVPTTFMAVSHNVPTVGKRCECSKMEFVDGHLNFVGWSTSTVKDVQDMGNNIYRVETRNNVYIVMVG